jgi:hypothetical protein
MHILTCHCVTGMIVPPPPGKGFIILDPAKWEELVKAFAESKKQFKDF